MNVFFCHIPKCAGMSIKEMMDSHYGHRNCYDITDIFLRRKQNNPGIFYGHGLYSLTDALPQPLYTFTILREPISRLLSYWKHIHRDGPDRYPRFAHLIRLPFSEAIHHPDFTRFSNGQTTILGAQGGAEYSAMYGSVNNLKDFARDNYALMHGVWNTCDDEMLVRAKNALRNMRFGFQERFEESLRHVFSPLGILPSRVRTNGAPASQKDFEVSTEDLIKLRELNKYDLELYKFAENLYKLINP